MCCEHLLPARYHALCTYFTLFPYQKLTGQLAYGHALPSDEGETRIHIEVTLIARHKFHHCLTAAHILTKTVYDLEITR